MSITRNRELSQFGSFIYVENSTQEIGITTGPLPFVGIGTTNPQKKLHVVGDIQIEGDLLYEGQLEFGNSNLNTTGIITAAGFYNPLGQQLVGFDSWDISGSTIYRSFGNVGIGTSIPTSKLEVVGDVVANSFIGSGNQLTNIVTSLTAGSGISINQTIGNIIISSSGEVAGVLTATSGNFSGIITASAFFGDGSGLTGIAIGSTGSINTSGIITASAFFGDGSGLTGIAIGSTGSINTSGIITASAFFGDGSGLTGISTNPGLSVSNDTTTNSSFYPLLSQSTSGIITASRVSSSKLTFNPSTGNLSATTFSGALSGNATSATNATNTAISNNTTTNATYYPTFVSGTTGNLGQTVSSSKLTFNPSTGTLSATTFSGALSGNATSATTATTATTATNATNTVISNNTTTNATYYPTFVSGITGNLGQTVSSSKLTFNPSTGTLTVVDINSTSDLKLKENIRTIQNATETVQSLRGVSFDWKETGKSSYGVIAQELEEILPELVNTEDVKSVNYNGIIGVLIESIKELKKEIEELKNTK